uniref:Free fatty acid receptor 1 n=1 Tax=Falco tinnunculus TaxID=100819 RepID=A0A8C4U186_FALTI
MSTSSDVLLLNLTAADLLLLLFLPFRMAEATAGMTWPLPVDLCPVANFCFFSSIYLSTLFLAALSVERYLGVVFPLRYKSHRRPTRAVATSVVLWLLVFSHCSVIFVAHYHSGRNPVVVNGSMGVTSGGSVVEGFKLGSSRLAKGEGLEPNGVTLGSSKGFDLQSFNISNPKDSISGGFSPNGSRISSPDGPRISSPGGSITDGFNPSSSEISSPDGSRISSPGGSIAGGFIHSSSRISSPNLLNPKVSKISSPSDPMDLPRRGSKTPPGTTSPLNTSSSSKSTISTSQTSTQAASSPTTIISQTSSPPRSSAPTTPHNHPRPPKCYDDFSEDQLNLVLPLRLEIFLLLFLLPFMVTIFCYVNFTRVLLARPNIPSEKKHRAVGLAVATMVNLGVCFMPYNLSHLVGFVEGRSPSWRVYVLLLTSLNAALDPIIFYFSSTAVQKATAGVVLALKVKFWGWVGWCYGVCSPEAPRDESEGS